ALQVSAYVVWWRAAHRAAPREESSGAPGNAEQVILCVGDSFTYGLGAKSQDGAYPAHLERQLKSRGHASRVINSGWPGLNSLQALQKIQSLLAEVKPDLVCIMLGRNDGWSAPPLRAVDDLTLATDGRSFRWTWRTGQLLKILLDRIRMTIE